MSVPLRDVIARTDLGLRPLSGEPGDRVVRWVHICELPDPALYLNGKELLLTAGVDFPTREADIDHYVARLVEADTAALGFGVTPVYDEVPVSLGTRAGGTGCRCSRCRNGCRSSTSARPCR